MRDLSATLPVQAPSGFALAFLNTYVSDLGHGSEHAQLPLHFTVSHLAGLTLERDVNVRVDYVTSPAGAPAQLAVAWEPDASVFPRFDGTMTAEPLDDRSCDLTIHGTYDAPGGLAGQLFDAIIGVRIAHGTLEQLLMKFRAAIEDDYQTRMEYA